MDGFITLPILIQRNRSESLGLPDIIYETEGSFRPEHIIGVLKWNDDALSEEFNGEHTCISLTSGNEYVVPMYYKDVQKVIDEATEKNISAYRFTAKFNIPQEHDNAQEDS